MGEKNALKANKNDITVCFQLWLQTYRNATIFEYSIIAK
jgi:hypothetical protein